MPKHKKKPSRASLSKSQQRGAFLLALVFAVLLAGMIGVHYYDKNPRENSEKVNLSLQQQRRYLDSMAKSIEPKAEKKYKIYPFNPNFISDEKGYRLGLSPNEIDRLHVFRKKGKWVNSKTDFQRVTQVSDSMLNAISPYFKFPDWVIERRARTQNIKRKNEKSTKSPFTEKRDLNLANREELMKVSGIGEAFADRIIKLRRKFKKFDSIIQIKDVYGIPPETEKNIMAAFYVKKGAFEKVNINKASVAEITENRYIDYELARKIVLYRRLHERIENFEELGSIEGFPSYRKDRLKIYFTLN